MTISPTPFLGELAAGHAGPPIPAAKRAYFQQRLRNRFFNFLLEKFVAGQSQGLTKAALARRIGKTPEQINRWLGAPSNLTLDTASDLVLGICAEEFEPASFSPLNQVESNYSLFEHLTGYTSVPSNTEQKSAEQAHMESLGVSSSLFSNSRGALESTYPQPELRNRTSASQ